MKKELVSVEYRPAKGGMISTTNMRTKRPGVGGGPDFNHEREEMVHPSMEQAQAHMGKMMAGCFPRGAAPVEPESK